MGNDSDNECKNSYGKNKLFFVSASALLVSVNKTAMPTAAVV